MIASAWRGSAHAVEQMLSLMRNCYSVASATWVSSHGCLMIACHYVCVLHVADHSMRCASHTCQATLLWHVSLQCRPHKDHCMSICSESWQAIDYTHLSKPAVDAIAQSSLEFSMVDQACLPCMFTSRMQHVMSLTATHCPVSGSHNLKPAVACLHSSSGTLRGLLVKDCCRFKSPRLGDRPAGARGASDDMLPSVTEAIAIIGIATACVTSRLLTHRS